MVRPLASDTFLVDGWRYRYEKKEVAAIDTIHAIYYMFLLDITNIFIHKVSISATKIFIIIKKTTTTTKKTNKKKKKKQKTTINNEQTTKQNKQE